MKIRLLVPSVLLLSIVINFSKAQDIIPMPAELTKHDKPFYIDSSTKILYQRGLKAQAELLAEFLCPATGWDYQIEESQNLHSNSIILSLADYIPDEGYELEVSESTISIQANSGAGIFYGIQTLLQLLPPEIYNNQRQIGTTWKVEGVNIKDKPEYVWRGMMLDVSRYFFDKYYVMKYIDMMSMYKLNTLHLHLIDDAGWRLEIKKYPKLTSVGAWRGQGEKRTGGYYTQEDIKELVEYAALRNIDIIPEIEVPAHTLAALAAYPFLSCNEEPVKVQEQHSISRELYCVGKESTFEFLGDVFKEAFELFPSKYIHIGGDEARYDRWKQCPHCQKRKNDLGLKDEAELQVYFNKRIQSMVQQYGKTIVGWDEIIDKDLENKAVGMVWHNKNSAFEATELGHDIVLTLTDYLYFDFPESSIPGEVKAATWMPPISLEKVYQFDPVIEGLEKKYRPQVLGGHGALWSDQFIHGTILQEIELINENRAEAYFDYLTFPRMSALAEVVWTPKSMQNWEGYGQRLRTHYNRYDHAGYGYRVPIPKLESKEQTSEGYIIELENIVQGAEIRFTTDGIKPNVYSEVYSKPVLINRLQDFQAITVVNRRQFSLPLMFPVSYPEFKGYGIQMAEWRAVDVLSEQVFALERNASGKIKKNGTYEIAFLHTDGENSLEVQGMSLYKNRKLISEDMHTATTGTRNKENVFEVSVDDYETGAEFMIKADIKGIGGNDSNGVIFIKLME